MKLLVVFTLAFASLIAAPLETTTRARSALVMNADTGVVLYEKNGYTPAFPGSTTKVATALFALEEKKLDLSQMVKASAEAVRHNPGKRTDDVISYLHESDASMMGIIRGEVLSLEALFHGLFMVSGNDAANVIAEAASGSIPKFIEELNEYVQKIGCKNTHFMNPHGYHHSKHVTTPYDLCLIMQKAMQSPVLRQIMAKTSYIRPKTNKRPEAEIKNFNLLLNPSKKFFYSKAIAGKTGFNSFAGKCLLAAANDGNRTLLTCVLGCETNGDRFEETRRLFDLAYAQKKVERLLVDGRQKFTKILPGAKKNLTASLVKNLSLSYFPAEEPDVKAFVAWNHPVMPIQKGSVVGEVRIVNQSGEVVAKEKLYAAETVTSTFLFALKEKWNQVFR